MAEIVMPQLGETVTEGVITKWFKQVGEAVAEDEILFEVSTDKVDSEVPATAAGILIEICVPEGVTVEVGTILAILGAAEPAATVATPSVAAPIAAAVAPAVVVAAPSASSKPEVAGDEEETDGGDGRLLSPIVRRLAREHDVDIDQVEGTGVGGRITRSDVQRAIDKGTPAEAASSTNGPSMGRSVTMDVPAAAPVGPVASVVTASAPPSRSPIAAPVPMARGGQRVPLNRIRKLTGDHMVMSQATSAHTLTVMEVDFEGVDRVRRTLRDQWKATEGFSLTYLPFIARAASDAIAEYPFINASVGDGELVVHGDVNLGIAVDLSFEGLVAPVVRQADGKRLRAIAREIFDLAGRARSRQLRPDDVTGGTFTLTNPGQYGTMMQFPIINQPQVAILSTDGIRRKPWVVTDAHGAESIAIRPIGLLALAWDHRAFDGAYAAAFLDRLRDIIETRDWSAEVM